MALTRDDFETANPKLKNKAPLEMLSTRGRIMSIVEAIKTKRTAASLARGASCGDVMKKAAAAGADAGAGRAVGGGRGGGGSPPAPSSSSSKSLAAADDSSTKRGWKHFRSWAAPSPSPAMPSNKPSSAPSVLASVLTPSVLASVESSDAEPEAAAAPAVDHV